MRGSCKGWLQSAPVGLNRGVRELCDLASMCPPRGTRRTQRQKVLFGPLFESHVTYVQCDKEAAKCAAAGVHGLPSWDVEVGAEKKRLEGFHFLVALEELAGGKRA